MTPPDTTSGFAAALPFGLSLLTVPLAWIGAVWGGWTVLLLPAYAWWAVSGLDALVGLNLENADPELPDDELTWYRMLTIIWFPVQFITLFSLIAYVTHSDHLNLLEMIVLFIGVGVMTGSIGIVYAHELLHQSDRRERWLGDLLLASVLYSHFRSEHLLVHHVMVGTPSDAVTAKYGEGFHRYFFRVLWQCPPSAWRAEARRLERRGKPAGDPANPFWRYALLQLGMLWFAWLVGGWAGLGLFLLQAFVAIWQLELTNYIEHYGLTRKYLGDGRYEPVRPRHSWNAAHRVSNWILINLQRHSDHHTRPDRRFPLLQTYGEDEAPQLPYGYPLMGAIALVPSAWRKTMNPRVQAWRQQYYPEIEDWAPYTTGMHAG